MKRDQAYNFEALKAGYAQTKGGHSLRFTIATNDLPKEVAEAEIGTRFLVALVVMPESIEDAEAYTGKRAVQLAGILCKDQEFQAWFLTEKEFHGAENDKELESMTAEGLRKYLHIRSRSDMTENSKATDRFYELYARYGDYQKVNNS